MRQEISQESFNHLVELAALELDQQEAEYLLHQLNAQLKVIQELEAIALDNTSAVTSHGVPFTSAISPELRLDEWLPFPHRADLLAQVPELSAGYIIVPEIPHTDLE